jgi:FAD/FMN-containing dehydrogenase
MEYALPAERGCLLPRSARGTQQAFGAWPGRSSTAVRADDAASPAHGRETVTLSLHQGAELPWQDFFADLEPLLRAHGGRPHWGKRHNLAAAELAALYPRFEDFRRLRAELDPKGRFLNEHLRAVLAG